ncbi:rCG52567, partial [Rattus norvegicus]
ACVPKCHVFDSLAVPFPPGPVELASPGACYLPSQLTTDIPHQYLDLSLIP